MERRIQDRLPAVFHIRVTELANPEFSASGEALDMSDSGIGVYLPLCFTPGSTVRLNVKDSVLYGVVSYSRPERSFFRTGIQVADALIGKSGLSQILREAIAEAMPSVQLR